MKRVLKQGLAIAMSAAMLFGLAGCGSNGDKNTEVNGTYTLSVTSGDRNSTVFSYEFDAENMTYIETIEAGDIKQTLQEGTYEADYEAGTVTLYMSGEPVLTYLINGDYLIVDGYTYLGDAPSGKKFDGTYTSEATGEEISFSSDGTYTDSSTSGTYNVKGGFIERTPDDGSTTVPLLIYEEGVTNSYLIRQ